MGFLQREVLDVLPSAQCRVAVAGIFVLGPAVILSLLGFRYQSNGIVALACHGR